MNSQVPHLLAISVLLAAQPIILAGEPETSSKPRRAFGIEKREPWTTSRIHGSPDPSSPYRTKVAFAKLKFVEPLAVANVPGTNRLVIAERKGRIFTFANDQQTDQKKLLLDVGQTVYSVVLHPDFQKNGLLFVSTEVRKEENGPGEIQVRRYQVPEPKTLRADPESQKIIVKWPAEGHRGGCLRFGPDGYLYIAVGDGSGIADQLETGQDLSDLLGSILRIDVDHAQGNQNYAIPDDNPFVNQPDARPEIWSYGHRQIWKFSFDLPTKRVWACEVGQDLWEMVYLIQKGGNYGWSIREGSHPFRPLRKKGPSPFVDPIVEHDHAEARSLTGGFVYRGKRLKGLREAYIYGDYDTGKIWSVHYDGKRARKHQELADTQLRIVAFGQGNDGELYLVDFIGGQLHQLVPAPVQQAQVEFPRRLSDTGLFASTKDHTPAKGLIPYSVNAPLWSDGAIKERFIALPGDSKIEFETVTYPQPAPGALPGWRFPHDTVFVKTFAIDMEVGNPKSRRRLETRILHHKHMPGTDEVGAQFWRGYTYVWNEEQTDAVLLKTDGLNRELSIKDPAAEGGFRKQVWRFPSRAECTLCHTMSAKYALGVTTVQMNKDHDYGTVIANQLTTLEHLGMFTKPLPKKPSALPRIVDYRDRSQHLNLRGRSYLHANCSHCHRKWGGGNAEFQLLAGLPLDKTGIIGVRPGHGTFELAKPALLSPGDSDGSLIHFRMQKLGLGRMPHIASTVVDSQAVELMNRWIRDLNKKTVRRTGLAQGHEHAQSVSTQP